MDVLKPANCLRCEEQVHDGDAQIMEVNKNSWRHHDNTLITSFFDGEKRGEGTHVISFKREWADT